MYADGRCYEAVAIGVSAGGLEALSTILPHLPAEFPAPVLVVQHLSADARDRLPRLLDKKCALAVVQAEEKEGLCAGKVYVAPSNYHLLVEEDHTLSLSADDRVSFARPSVDVLFESAAEAFGRSLIGVLLTGAGRDGSAGLRTLAEYGGLAIVQDPATAEVAAMPEAALATVPESRVASLDEIGPLLLDLCGVERG